MIIYLGPGGRLGNLLFQYAFLEKIRKENEFAFTTALGGLKKILKMSPRYFDFNGKFVSIIEKHFIKPIIFHLFLRFRIFSSIIEEDGILTEKRGLFKKIRYCHGYFQSQGVDTKIVNQWKFHDSLINKALTFLQNFQGKKFFVHVRLTDYEEVVINGIKNASLPLSYYLENLNSLEKSLKGIWVFIFSDNIEKIRDKFQSLKNVVFCNNSAEIDFLIMGLCDGGILANSSFSWWAGFLCKKELPLIAPKFWMGFKSGKTYPIGFQVPFAEMRQVNIESS